MFKLSTVKFLCKSEMVEQKAWLAGDEPYPKSFTLHSHRPTQADSLAPSTYNVITLFIINLVLLPPITQKRKKKHDLILTSSFLCVLICLNYS